MTELLGCMSMRVLWAGGLLGQTVKEDFGEDISLDETLTKGIPFCQYFFLFELTERLAAFDTGFDCG